MIMTKEYEKYLAEHKYNVVAAFRWLCEHCPDITIDDVPIGDTISVPIEIFKHDESKFSKDEWPAYDEYFYGDKDDPDVKERFDYAWLHHIHNNPHHWQHWILFEDDPETGKEYKCLRIPEKEVIHMICDWWSFSFKKGDLNEIFDWYDDHRDKMKLHPETREKVEDILRRIKEEL